MKAVILASLVVGSATVAPVASAAPQEASRPAPEAPSRAATETAPTPAPSDKPATPGGAASVPTPAAIVTARGPAAAPAPRATKAANAPASADAGAAAPVDYGPIESRFNVRIDIDTVWNKSSSFDLISDRDTSVLPGISIGYAVLRSERLSLVPELGVNGNDRTGSAVFGGAVERTDLSAWNPYAGVSVRFAALSVLDVSARVSGGASILSFEMTPVDSSPKLSDDHVAPFMTLGGGFTLHTWEAAFQTGAGALRSLVAGIGLEAGYLLAGSVDLTPAPSGSVGRIRSDYSSIGTLERSGPYLKTSFSARF